MVVSEIELYNLLREKVGEPQAKALTEYIEAKVEKKYDEKKDTIVAELGAKIAETKVEILRWTIMTGLTVGLTVVGLLSGIMFAMLNAYLKH
jgi:hypothetical protein